MTVLGVSLAAITPLIERAIGALQQQMAPLTQAG
jgi:hypothetical protein